MTTKISLLLISCLLFSISECQIPTADYITDLPIDPSVLQATNNDIAIMVGTLSNNFRCGQNNTLTNLMPLDLKIIRGSIYPTRYINSRLYSQITTVKADLQIVKSEIIQYNNVVIGGNNTVCGDDNVVIGSSNSIVGTNQWIFTSNFASDNANNEILVVDNFLIRLLNTQQILYNQVGDAVECLTEQQRIQYFNREWTNAGRTRRILI